MSDRYYSVVTGKDNFLANIIDEEESIEYGHTEGVLEPQFVKGFKKDVIVLTKIGIPIPNGNEVGVLPFKSIPFGSEYVSIPVTAITSIYFVKESLATQIRAALSGLAIK